MRFEGDGLECSNRGVVVAVQGLRELVVQPMNEMRREDGKIVRGLTRGATSFGVSAAAAALDASQQVAGAIQSIAELAFDLVTPDLPYRDQRRRNNSSLAQARSAVPVDARDGFDMARITIQKAVYDTAREWRDTARNDRARIAEDPHHAYGNFWNFRGLLRQIIPTIVRPMVVGAEATGQAIGGLKSQLRVSERARRATISLAKCDCVCSLRSRSKSARSGASRIAASILPSNRCDRRNLRFYSLNTFNLPFAIHLKFSKRVKQIFIFALINANYFSHGLKRLLVVQLA